MSSIRCRLERSLSPDALVVVAVSSANSTHHGSAATRCSPHFLAEARLLLSAMAARCPLWLLIPDHDRANEPAAIKDLLPELRRRIHAVIGGDTTFACEPRHHPAILPGDGRYVAPNGITMAEHTLALFICLPPTLNDREREQLLTIFTEFGLNANQEVVQVVAGLTTCWLPTGELIDALALRNSSAGNERLRAG